MNDTTVPAPRVDPHTVGPWITSAAQRYGQKAAIIFGDSRLSYHELDASSTQLARALLADGLVPGERVGVLSENRPEQVVVLFACAKAGLVYFPMNWRLSNLELAEQLSLIEPARWLVSRQQRSRIDDSLASLALAPEELESTCQEVGADARVELPMVSGSDPLAIIATSGSTGRAKGVVLSHANFFWTNLSLDIAAPISANDVVLQVLPQFHVGGWNVQPMLAWWRGATVILEASFDPGRAIEVIEREKVTTMAGVPTTYVMIARHERFRSANLSSLRFGVVGGAAMPHTLVTQWHERGVEIVQGYGLSEAAPNVFCLDDADADQHPGSVGRPYPYVDVALFDSTSASFVEGAGQGELWVRGPAVFCGYWRDASATQAAKSGEWLRTGDIAARDEQGFYRIVGRLKEMFVSGGENVYPVEVENAITSFKDVVNAAVVGVDDQLWGEVGVAFVETVAGSRVDPLALAEHCRGRLASYKVPTRFVIVDELPHNAVGKVDKASLRNAARARVESA